MITLVLIAGFSCTMNTFPAASGIFRVFFISIHYDYSFFYFFHTSSYKSFRAYFLSVYSNQYGVCF